MIVLSHQKLKIFKFKHFYIRKIKNRARNVQDGIREIRNRALKFQSGIRKIKNRGLKLQGSIREIKNMTLNFQGGFRKIQNRILKFQGRILKNRKEVTLCFLLNHKKLQLNSSPALLLKREGSKHKLKSPSLCKRGI